MKIKIIDNYHIAFNDGMKPIFVSNETVDNVKNNRPINIKFYSDNEERKKQVNKYIDEYNKELRT